VPAPQHLVRDYDRVVALPPVAAEDLGGAHLLEAGPGEASHHRPELHVGRPVADLPGIRPSLLPREVDVTGVHVGRVRSLDDHSPSTRGRQVGVQRLARLNVSGGLVEVRVDRLPLALGFVAVRSARAPLKFRFGERARADALGVGTRERHGDAPVVDVVLGPSNGELARETVLFGELHARDVVLRRQLGEPRWDDGAVGPGPHGSAVEDVPDAALRPELRVFRLQAEVDHRVHE
jgi:hypothetical protein